MTTFAPIARVRADVLERAGTTLECCNRVLSVVETAEWLRGKNEARLAFLTAKTTAHPLVEFVGRNVEPALFGNQPWVSAALKARPARAVEVTLLILALSEEPKESRKTVTQTVCDTAATTVDVAFAADWYAVVVAAVREWLAADSAPKREIKAFATFLVCLARHVDANPTQSARRSTFVRAFYEDAVSHLTTLAIVRLTKTNGPFAFVDVVPYQLRAAALLVPRVCREWKAQKDFPPKIVPPFDEEEVKKIDVETLWGLIERLPPTLPKWRPTTALALTVGDAFAACVAPLPTVHLLLVLCLPRWPSYLKNKGWWLTPKGRRALARFDLWDRRGGRDALCALSREDARSLLLNVFETRADWPPRVL